MLIEQSHEAKKQAYCPYSKFRVGSALLTVDDRVITGKLHVELVDFPQRAEGYRFNLKKRFTERPQYQWPREIFVQVETL